MTIRFSSSLILAAAALSFVAASGVQAASPAQPGAHAGQRVAAEAGEVTALRSAFDLLRHADHDYKGHRVKAMHAIALACRLMGTDIVPPGLRGAAGGRGTATGQATRHVTNEPEPQATSDAQLRQAQTIVQQVLSTIPSGKQPRITALLGAANSELTTALSIK